MSSEVLKRDQNHVTVAAAIGNDSDQEVLMLRSDPTTKELLVTSTTGIPVAANGTLGNGSRTVTTAGTRVQLSLTSVSCKKVTIQALASNTGSIYIGGSTVASTNGYTIFATQSFTLTVSNLNLVYLDSSVNGEGVIYMYEN